LRPFELSVLLDQPALPGAGFATDEGCREFAVPKLRVRFLEAREFSRATDERRSPPAEAVGSNRQITRLEQAMTRAGFGLSLQFGRRQLLEGKVPLGEVPRDLAHQDLTALCQAAQAGRNIDGVTDD